MNRMAVAASIVLCLAPTLCLAANAVPAYVLELPESVSDVLIADTGTAMLHRFGRTASGIKQIDQRYMSIGLNGVGKKRAWDRKTPLGIYFITESLDTKYLHDKYGVAAYALDYPNAWDRYNERTGDGIWLHGVDHNGSTRPPRDTDGCLALPNSELLSLGDTLKPLTTPVIVTRELTWSTQEELDNLRIELRTALETWRQSLQEYDLSSYLSLYSDEFRHGEMDKKAWASRRSGNFDARTFESLNLTNVMLIADPEEPGLYLSRFTQEFETVGGSTRITKRLYWRRHEDHNWQIVAEDSG